MRLKDHGIGSWSAVTNAKIDSVDLTGCRNQSEQVRALVDHMAKISFMEPISDEDFANLTEEGEHASYAHAAYMGYGPQELERFWNP